MMVNTNKPLRIVSYLPNRSSVYGYSVPNSDVKNITFCSGRILTYPNHFNYTRDHIALPFYHTHHAITFSLSHATNPPGNLNTVEIRCFDILWGVDRFSLIARSSREISRWGDFDLFSYASLWNAKKMEYCAKSVSKYTSTAENCLCIYVLIILKL